MSPLAPGLEQWVNRVHCGDAVEYLAQLPAESINVVVTSPPYNIRTTRDNRRDRDVRVGTTGNRPTRRECSWWYRAELLRGEFGAWHEAMPEADYIASQRAALDAMMRVLAPDGAIYYNYRWAIRGGLLQQPVEILAGFPVRQIIIWARDGGVAFNDRFYLPTYQVVYLIAKRRFRLRRKGHHLTDIWQISQERNNPHPAPFPVALPYRCINSAAKADVVLDPYMGSGSTAIAAEACGSQWIGFELNPAYVRMATARIEAARPALYPRAAVEAPLPLESTHDR